jgi:hypothetical protein
MSRGVGADGRGGMTGVAFDADGKAYGDLADPHEVAAEALAHLADGPTWIYGSDTLTGGSPFGALSRRDAVLALSGGAAARSDNG